MGVGQRLPGREVDGFWGRIKAAAEQKLVRKQTGSIMTPAMRSAQPRR
ncbi:hypothetical protein [Rhodococcus sp. KBS0724]|jgi:hypothetical protein|nr:hypothetical protein [Rhodococcus sp. KBS0724]